MATTTISNTTLARRLIEAVQDGDEDAIGTLVTGTHRNHAGQSSDTPGPEGVIEAARWLRETFDDVSMTPEDLIASEDRVVARVRFRGTYRIDVMGQPTAGKSIDVQHVHIWRVADGRVAEHWLVRDDLGALRQMGLSPGS